MGSIKKMNKALIGGYQGLHLSSMDQESLGTANGTPTMHYGMHYSSVIDDHVDSSEWFVDDVYSDSEGYGSSGNGDSKDSSATTKVPDDFEAGLSFADLNSTDVFADECDREPEAQIDQAWYDLGMNGLQQMQRDDNTQFVNALDMMPNFQSNNAAMHFPGQNTSFPNDRFKDSLAYEALIRLVQGQVSGNRTSIDGMPYDTLIVACVEMGSYRMMDALLKEMLRQYVVPRLDALDSVTLMAKELSAISYWMKVTLELGETPSHDAYNHVIMAYCQAGNTFGAEQWLSQQIATNIRPDKIAFEAVIRVSAKQGDMQRSEKWLKELMNNGIQPDALILGCVIVACTMNQAMERAETWLGLLVKLCLSPHPGLLHALNAMIAEFAKDGKTAKADAWLRYLIEHNGSPSGSSVSQVIRQFAVSGDLDRAEFWMQNLKSCGNKTTKHGYNSMIMAAAKIGNAQKADHYLKAMIEDGIMPTEVECTVVIHGFAKIGRVREAEEWLTRIDEMGIAADHVIYNSLIHACSRAGNVARAEHWLWALLKKGLTPQDVSFNTVISACATAGDLAKAKLWFLKMMNAGLEPNKITFNSLLNTCARAENVNEAESVFEQMIKRGIAPDIVTYGTLCKAHAAKGDVTRVRNLMNEALMQQIKLNEYLYQSLLTACEHAQPPQPKQAQKAISEMVAQGLEVKRSHRATLQRCIGIPRAKKLLQSLGAQVNTSEAVKSKSKCKGSKPMGQSTFP
jgi:pentatricopeptide repeat protein